MNILNKFNSKQQVYKEVFNNPAGEKVLADLAVFCGAISPTYREGDSHDTAYREGMRRVYLRIFNYLHKNPADIAKMISAFEKGK